MDTIYHAMRSLVMYNDSALDIHIWIDRYWNGIPYDHSHRIHTHTTSGLRECIQKFGKKAEKHFMLHMMDDGVKFE